MRLEHLIFANLIGNESYMRKVIPFIHRDYFAQPSDQTLFRLIEAYVDKYNASPSKEALLVDLGNTDGLTEQLYSQVEDTLGELKVDDVTRVEWLVDKTEEFCQDRALYNAVAQSIQVLDDKKSDIPRSAIPKMLQDALAVSFDTKLGHDYLEDAEARFDFYHTKVARLPFDIEILNKITKGGVPPKTLNILLAGTNVGKSLIMCHLAAAYMQAGKNVLYITMEMAEERISERIDANLLNVDLDDMLSIPKANFMAKIERIRQKTVGRLKVVEYPTASAGAANFRHLLNELRLKENFEADVILIDYINICTSSRIKASSNANSFTIVKAIAEELRGLAVEFNVPIWSATQTTRTGLSNSDLELGDVSESIALASTCDFMLAISQSEELAELNQYMFKQLKSRYGDKNKIKRFMVGVDKGKMRLFDIDQDEASTEDKPLMDKTSFGEQDYERHKPKSKFRGSFDAFK